MSPVTGAVIAWNVSTRCASGQCVRVAHADGMILIGDTKRPDAAPLHFSPEEWTAFVEGVKGGDFDALVPATGTPGIGDVAAPQLQPC